MECGAGFTFDADTNLTGPEAVRFTFQSAAQNGLTLVRAFGHGHDAYRSIILQPRPGARPGLACMIMGGKAACAFAGRCTGLLGSSRQR
jgi:hypothetical protein